MTSESMDPLPRIRVRKEIFGQVIRSTETDTPPSPKEDSVGEWKKSLLIRDLDLVQASIKIIVAMPAESQHTSKLGKLIHVSLNDVEGVLLYNYIPIRKLDLSSSSNLPWNRVRDTEQNDDNALRPWRRALIARNLDLVHTIVHALLLNLPKKHKNQLVDTALATLKDLHNIILNDDSSAQQIATFTEPFKADESDNDASTRKSFDSLSQSQSLDGWEYQSESQDGMETENMAVSLARPHEDPRGPRDLQELLGPKKLQNLPRSLQIKTMKPKKLNVVLPLRDESIFPGHGNKKYSAKFCDICKTRLSDGSCISCRNFAMKMETSMKQNVFYECSHVNNAGGFECKVCRFNLILKFMPNYASQKVEVIHKQIGPRPKSQNENSQESFEDKRSRVSSPNLPSTSSFQLLLGSNDLRSKPIRSPLIERPTETAPSIVISGVSSLAEPENSVCPVCAFETPGGHCGPCSSFAQHMEALMKKDIFYECAHENNSGSPKCRVCRYNRIALLRADRENTRKIVPWSKY